MNRKTRPKAWTKTLSVGKLSDLLGFNCKFTSVPISIPYRGFYGTGRAGAGVALKEKMQEKSQEKSEKGKLWFGPLLWQILNQTRKCFQRAWRGGNEDAERDARKQTRVQREKPGDRRSFPCVRSRRPSLWEEKTQIPTSRHTEKQVPTG